MACRKRRANPLPDGAVMKACVPNVASFAHNLSVPSATPNEANRVGCDLFRLVLGRLYRGAADRRPGRTTSVRRYPERRAPCAGRSVRLGAGRSRRVAPTRFGRYGRRRRPPGNSSPDRGPHALVAQLDRASDFESEGREFESLRARHFRYRTGHSKTCRFCA
jgi:hypothetical protein